MGIETLNYAILDLEIMSVENYWTLTRIHQHIYI
jgi:hypothetical protein